ncbi:hypothetical protein [Mucisphaera sp.]|uniref:hypothetical protein n=1 Tax=Mucisphaera sp. TaxID=2913024 RepID=UPI003D12CD91
MSLAQRSVLTLTALLLLVNAGCQEIGFIGQAAAHLTGLDRIPAQHEIDRRPTVVLVDDPNNLLGSPALATQLAGLIGFHLVEHTDLVDEDLISQRRVSELSERLGKAFAQTPMDAIGEQVGAEQLISVLIVSADQQMAPGLMRPRATARVELIDVTEGRRIFPPEADASSPSLLTQGYTVSVDLQVQSAQQGRATLRLASQQLVQALAIEVAQLFYSHEPDS